MKNVEIEISIFKPGRIWVLIFNLATSMLETKCFGNNNQMFATIRPFWSPTSTFLHNLTSGTNIQNVTNIEK